MPTVSRSVTQIIIQKPGADEAYSNISTINSEVVSDKITTNSYEQVEFNNIHWRYTGAAKDVIDGVSLTINRGESMAFIGASGSAG